LGLGPGAQRIEFRFTALSLVAPERNRFKYRLIGLENDWVEAGPQRVAAYPHVLPGHYEFQVAACNNDGVWNTGGAAIRFTVPAHFWQTGWFLVLVAVALLAAGGWAVRAASVQRLRRKLRRLEERHSVEQERTRIARDIHDELGASLTSITLLTEVGQKHKDKPEAVAADLGKISATAREAVRAMDAIVWAVNPRNDSLDHLANYLSQFAEEFLRPSSIRCRLDVPADLPEHPLSTEARHHLFLAVKEALNNVVRHSGASEVWLRMSMNHGELQITVADNGHGIPASAPDGGGHDGLANIRKRIEDLGGRFELESHPASGTSLRLQLPLASPRDAHTP
jgi:signal transduction histidine kinase